MADPFFQFSVDVNFVGIQDNQWLIELIALVENVGNVECEFENIDFTLRLLHPTDDILDGKKKINRQVVFPDKFKKGKWLKSPQNKKEDKDNAGQEVATSEIGNTIVEPGTRQKYTYITRVPTGATFLHVQGNFYYQEIKQAGRTAADQNKWIYHNDVRIFKLPPLPDQ